MAAEVLQQLDLAQGALGENLFAEDICDLFDSDTVVGLVIHGGTANSEEEKGYGQQKLV